MWSCRLLQGRVCRGRKTRASTRLATFVSLSHRSVHGSMRTVLLLHCQNDPEPNAKTESQCPHPLEVPTLLLPVPYLASLLLALPSLLPPHLPTNILLRSCTFLTHITHPTTPPPTTTALTKITTTKAFLTAV